MDRFREVEKTVIKIAEALPRPDVESVSVIDDHLSELQFRQAEDPYEGKNFSEVLRAKREALERDLQTLVNQKEPQILKTTEDSLEARKKRLAAQRDALIAKRKAEREKELVDYN